MGFQDPGVLLLVVVGDVGRGNHDAWRPRGADLADGGRPGAADDEIRRRHELWHIEDILPHVELGILLQLQPLLADVGRHPPPAVGARGVDVVIAAVLGLQDHEAGDFFIHLPGAQAPPGRDDELLLPKPQRLAGGGAVAVEELAPHRRAGDDDLLGVGVVLLAVREGHHDPIHVLGHHAGGEAGHGVGFVHRRGDAQLGAHVERRVAGIAAGAHDDVGGKVPDDPLGLAHGAGHMAGGGDVVPDARRGELSLEVGDFNGLQVEALPGHQFIFHAVLGADEEDPAVRDALL